MLTFNDAHRSPKSVPARRNAIVTLETIVWLPVLAILLAAVIEMGLIMTGAMHVAAASRLGAKLAAETGNIHLTPAATTAMTLRTAVDNYLANAGYGASASAGVRLQHNVVVADSGANGTCPEVTSPALPSPNAVRVVVCVDVTTVAPNLLDTFGFDTSGMTLELFTTYPYE